MNKPQQGFDYESDREKIREFMRLSVHERLRWLEEMRSFIQNVSSPTEQELRRKLRD